MSEIENAKKLFFEALEFFDSGDFQKAELRLRDALRLTPDSVSVLTNLAVVLLRRNEFCEAREYAEKAVSASNNNIEALLILSTCYNHDENFSEVLSTCNKIIAIEPNNVAALNNRGLALEHFSRFAEAIDSYERATTLDPNYSEPYINRGNALRKLNRYDEAFAAYDKALVLKPDLESAWLGRGNVFFNLKRYDEAIAAYDRALALKSDFADVWLVRGNLLYELKRYDEAVRAYDRALACKPDLIGAEGIRLYRKMQLCDWRNFAAECAHLISSIKCKKLNSEPFPLLAIPSSDEERLQYAKLWTAHKYPPYHTPFWQGERYNHDRIRVAYLSADFHQHATSFLMAGMFECHDKSRFEITAISIGPDDNSEMRQCLKRSFDYFIDATILSDEEIASRIRETEIDILIDLKGFTQDARTNVFARRPAPIQANYIGYPGTMGAEYIDYIIADQTVIPENSKQYYLEKIVYLPTSYQVNDSKRFISDNAFTRTQLGLPPTGFVFCSLNNNYKITPRIFDCWMRILKQVESSVLWLLEDNPTAASNLRKEATTRGVNPERLIFAKRLPLAEHLARHRLADLFLDTLPYNAHTTASDALWAGLPILTCLGETFAGRVAASLLNAIGLPELIAATPEAYEQMAIDLATHPEKLAVIKRKLAENRLTTPLFDTKLFTKHIEAAYTAMYERHQAGLAPDHISIPN
jgi:protein O-GlcNAc transferase